MQNPRRSRRFLVSPAFPLSVQIPSTISKTYKLRTIGEGGLGFYGSPRDAKLLNSGEVVFELMSGSHRIQLRGRVQYSRFLPKVQGGVNYVGIQFENLDPRNGVLLKTILQQAVSKGHLLDS